MRDLFARLVQRFVDNNGPEDVAISGTHIELTPTLKSFVRHQTDRLFCHGLLVSCVSVDLERDDLRACGPWFVARGYVRTAEREVFASAGADECQKSVSCLIDHLDHIVAR